MNKIEQRFYEQVLKYKYDTINKFHDHIKIRNKIKAIAAYLNDNGINDVIIGISGGIDSAVVLALLKKVKEFYIPTLKIHAYCITFDHVYCDIFDIGYVNSLKSAFCSDDITITKKECSNSLYLLFEDLGIKTDAKLLAQSSYALRYQMLFTYAQLHNGITIGTTNRDEFDYVGWFGKNSDMVVDLQVITDWHKCEVVEAAKKLGVPDEIINRTPSGDLIDGSSDEDNFGCTYDELAYFSGGITQMCEINEYGELFHEKYKKVMELHEKNKHKYQGQTFNPIFIK